MRQPLQNSFYRNIVAAFSGWRLSWYGVKNNLQGEWWLIGQILLIAAHLIPSWPHPSAIVLAWKTPLSLLGASLFILGAYKTVKAFLALGANLSPLPDPKPRATLVTIGPYNHCRHPLYQGILICSAGSIFYLYSLLHISLFICLTLLLIGKAKREEEKLQKQHPEYSQYMKKTPSIIKGVSFLDWRT